MRCFLVLSGWFFCASVAFAFDTGLHHDLTGAVLRDFQFDNIPIKVVQVENWLADYYSNAPTSTDEMKRELAKLHFDNLFNSKEVKWYWARLSHNTLDAARRAAAENDPHRLLTIMAISLHAVQDFYSHSNWVDTHPRPANGYSTQTYLNSGEPARAELFTGFYDSMGRTPPPGFPEHGDYNRGLNRDHQDRPKWDESFVFAYAACWEWVAKLKSEVDATRPGFWEKVRTFSLSDVDSAKLKYDAEAAYRISLWISASGANGHWKGQWSGRKSTFVPFAAKWIASPNSISVDQFRGAKVQNMLTPNLYHGGPPPTMPAFPSFNLNRRLATIRFANVKEKRDEGLLEPRIDVGENADFFATARIGNVDFVERVIQDQTSVESPWWFIAIVDPAVGRQVAVSVDVRDEDDFAAGGDDVCDINPIEGSYGLKFNVTLANASLTGDVQGTHRNAVSALTVAGKKPDQNRASVTFFVDVQALNRP